MNEQERQAGFQKLREKFPPSVIGKIPKGGTQLDFVGHAPTTDRLLSVDPEWTWEPVAFDERGLPLLIVSKDGWPIGLWIRLTVLGVTRLGFGSVAPGKADAVKELIGDAIRNGAMRAGVALDLWAKEELESNLSGAEQAGPEQSAPPTSSGSGGEAGSRAGVWGSTSTTASSPNSSAQPSLGGGAESTSPSIQSVPPSEETLKLLSVIGQALDNDRVKGEDVHRHAIMLLQRNDQVPPEAGVSRATLPELGTVILKALVRELELEEKAGAKT